MDATHTSPGDAVTHSETMRSLPGESIRKRGYEPKEIRTMNGRQRLALFYAMGLPGMTLLGDGVQATIVKGPGAPRLSLERLPEPTIEPASPIIRTGTVLRSTPAQTRCVCGKAISANKQWCKSCWEQSIADMAAKIGNQAMLDQLLEGVEPGRAKRLLDLLTPHLSFTPGEKIDDCPTCGLRRGSMIAHQCLSVA